MARKIEEVRGREVVIRFDGSRCIHSRNCVLGRPDVFVPNVEGEWIHPDRATPDEVAHLALTCPSGAITYERLDGGLPEPVPKVNTLRIRENGPLALHAPHAVDGSAPALRATLCRCGASRAKPWCDGSHTSIGFQATGEPATKESQPLASRDGSVTITPSVDGPLRIEGALELVSGTGRTINRVTDVWLCRCGGSSNKPYCDGTHRRNGFKS